MGSFGASVKIRVVKQPKPKYGTEKGVSEADQKYDSKIRRTAVDCCLKKRVENTITYCQTPGSPLGEIRIFLLAFWPSRQYSRMISG